MYIVVWVGIMIASIAYSCYHSEIFATPSGKPNFKPYEEECKSLNEASQYYTYITFGIGAASGVFRVIIGLAMLIMMKQNLYYPYLEIRKGVVLTIMATIIVLSFNAVYNFVNRFSYNIWIFFILHTNFETGLGEYNFF